MNRRTFLAGASMAALSSAFPWHSARADDAMKARAARFAAAQKDKPWLLGYQSARAAWLHADENDIQVEGRIPQQLNGTFYRNGPGGHEVAGHRYGHWFDGDGLLHAFDLRDGRVSHRGRLVATPKRIAESKAGRPLYDGFGSSIADPAPVRGPDNLNPANIHVLSHGGRLMALWEGGSPAEVDPETLEFREFVAFSRESKGLPFSAHTRTDADGTLWSIGYVGWAGKIVIYRVASNGKLTGLKALDSKPTPMLHDFLITERWLVLVMPPWKFEMSAGDTFLSRHVWRPEEGGRVWLIDKNTMDVVRQFDIPAFWSFHYANAWEDAKGAIHFDFPRYDSPDLTSHGFADVMDGEWPEGAAPEYVRAVLDPQDGLYREERLITGIAAEFPRISSNAMGRRHDRTLLSASGGHREPKHPGFDATAIVDVENGALDRFVHDPFEIAEEAVFAAGEDGTQWVLQTVLDFREAATKLKVFNATDLAAGPVAVATLPYALPLGLHGLFVT